MNDNEYLQCSDRDQLPVQSISSLFLVPWGLYGNNRNYNLIFLTTTNTDFTVINLSEMFLQFQAWMYICGLHTCIFHTLKKITASLTIQLILVTQWNKRSWEESSGIWFHILHNSFNPTLLTVQQVRKVVPIPKHCHLQLLVHILIPWHYLGFSGPY
jgi:hypothetical protein